MLTQKTPKAGRVVLADLLNQIESRPHVIQTLVFNKDKFSRLNVLKFIERHNFRIYEIEETRNTYRVEQRDVDDFDRSSFKTIKIANGVNAICGDLI